ncbi:energy transducer TonB [Chitinophaga sp. 30R24]|uniref:energy transducer TonB n=1 Tax=Chitinophaga sp. 30R24 TaxID=3248838 RepID=UPI003B8F5951
MDSTNIRGNEFLDILFSGRNKDYGAYELRSRYDRRVRNAIIGTASIMLVIMGGYVLNNQLMAAGHTEQPVFKIKEIELAQLDIPKEPDPVIPPPPAVPATPPPVATTVAFTSKMVITKEDVNPDEMPPKQIDMKDKIIGVANIDGVEGGVDADMDIDLRGKGMDGGVVAAPPTAANDRPFVTVEIMPEFPGGEAALMKYLGKTTKYPTLAQENGIQGTVFVQFVVNRDGSISDVKTVGAVQGGGLEEEAIRVVGKMPKWKPGRQNGQNVSVFFNLPIRFALHQ